MVGNAKRSNYKQGMDCSARDRKSSYYLLGSMENKQDQKAHWRRNILSK